MKHASDSTTNVPLSSSTATSTSTPTLVLGVAAVVLDIEGTVGSLSHVHDVLLPYARERIVPWMSDHRDDPRHAELLREVRAVADDPSLDEQGAAAQLLAWSDADAKVPPLKALRAWIWAAGYTEGTLKGHVYDDVPGALTRWRKAGIARCIYSSGTVAAQVDWFAHSDHGDLTGLLDGYFDLATAGGKRAPRSYRIITGTIGVPPEQTLFLSDVPEELDAAESAGWRVIAVRREADPRGTAVPGRLTIAQLGELSLFRPGAGEAVRTPADTDGESGFR